MTDDDAPLYDLTDPALQALLADFHRHTMHYGTTAAVCGVQFNKCTETAIDRDDREIGRFLCRFSSKKGID